MKQIDSKIELAHQRHSSPQQPALTNRWNIVCCYPVTTVVHLTTFGFYRRNYVRRFFNYSSVRPDFRKTQKHFFGELALMGAFDFRGQCCDYFQSLSLLIWYSSNAQCRWGSFFLIVWMCVYGASSVMWILFM